MARKRKWTQDKSGRLIRVAANVMRDKGYLRGSIGNENVGFCVRGAVNYAYSGNANLTANYDYEQMPNARNHEVTKSLRDFGIYIRSQLNYDCVERFNDVTNDKDEVLRWMYKFADEVDPQK